jgi:hypothetical protein
LTLQLAKEWHPELRSPCPFVAAPVKTGHSRETLRSVVRLLVARVLSESPELGSSVLLVMVVKELCSATAAEEQDDVEEIVVLAVVKISEKPKPSQCHW